MTHRCRAYGRPAGFERRLLAGSSSSSLSCAKAASFVGFGFAPKPNANFFGPEAMAEEVSENPMIALPQSPEIAQSYSVFQQCHTWLEHEREVIWLRFSAQFACKVHSSYIFNCP